MSGQSVVQTHKGELAEQLEYFESLLIRFLAEQDVAPSSRTTYKSGMRQFFRWFAKQRIPQPTRETIILYKEWLDRKGLKPFTRSLYLVSVRRFFEWAEGHHIYPNIAKGVKGSRRLTKQHHKDSLRVQSVQKLLDSIDRSDVIGLRDYALINLLVRTGLRLVEIHRAHVGDLEHGPDDTILWVRGKGRDGKDEFVVLTPEALEPIQQYLTARTSPNSRAPLFASHSERSKGKTMTTQSLSRIIRERLEAAGIKTRRVTAHSLRHTFGVLAIKAGASLYDVQLAMRHAAPTTTEVYLGDIQTMKRREAAPERKVRDMLRTEGDGEL